MRLVEILKPANIKIPLESKTKAEAIGELVSVLEASGDVTDKKKVLDAVLEREATRTTPEGTWLTKQADDWTAGFLPATLWRVFERTHDPVWRDRAVRWTQPLTSETSHDDGDLGFKMYMTFAVQHQLTGDEAAQQTA